MNARDAREITLTHDHGPDVQRLLNAAYVVIEDAAKVGEFSVKNPFAGYPSGQKVMIRAIQTLEGQGFKITFPIEYGDSPHGRVRQELKVSWKLKWKP